MFKGTVTNILIESGSAKVVIDIGIPIVALITEKSLSEMGIMNGTNLYCIFKTMSVKVFK
jgi:molybdate/tungstate transport system ATP-binding protein